MSSLIAPDNGTGQFDVVHSPIPAVSDRLFVDAAHLRTRMQDLKLWLATPRSVTVLEATGLACAVAVAVSLVSIAATVLGLL